MKSMKRRVISTCAILIAIATCMLNGSVGSPATAKSGGNGLSGRVTDLKGQALSGLFVSARNSVTHRTTYALTQAQGNFRMPDLEAGDYEVQISERSWQGEPQQIKVSASAAATVALKVKPDTVDISELTSAELLPLLPEGEGKKVLLENCMTCHTLQKFVIASWDKDGWGKVVTRMKKAFGASLPEGKEGVLIDYLASTFAADSTLQNQVKQMRFKSPSPINVTYDSWDIPLQKSLPHTVTQDVKGNSWFTDPLGSRMGHLDVTTGQFKTWNTPTPNSLPHGIVVDKNGQVWFTARLQFEPANKIVNFDPVTEKFTEYPLPHNISGPHTLIFDSQGILWITEYEGNRLARFDPATKQFTEYPVPTKDAKPYGLDVDRQGVVWIAEIGSGSLGKFDPKVGKVIDYPTPTKNSGVRRVRADSKGRIWFTEFLADRLGMFDPKTEKMTEYLMPGVRPQPYAVEVTHDDKIWLSTWHQDSMIRFDPETKIFTTFPVPFLDLEIRDFRIDSDNTLWFVAMIPNKVVRMKIH